MIESEKQKPVVPAASESLAQLRSLQESNRPTNQSASSSVLELAGLWTLQDLQPMPTRNRVGRMVIVLLCHQLVADHHQPLLLPPRLHLHSSHHF